MTVGRGGQALGTDQQVPNMSSILTLSTAWMSAGLVKYCTILARSSMSSREAFFVFILDRTSFWCRFFLREDRLL